MWLFATLKADQIQEVLEIEEASFQRPWKRRAFEEEFACRDAAHYAVLSAGNRRLIGYVFLRIVFSEMHLLRIAVAPPWRRSGVASWAMERCFDQARRRGIGSVCLEVRAGNRAAIGLYDKLGFRRVGPRKRYYTDTGEDALVMVKVLNL